MAAQPCPPELYENIVTTSSAPFKRCIVPLRGGERAHRELCYYTVHVSSVLIAPTTVLDVFQGIYGGRSAALKGIKGPLLEMPTLSVSLSSFHFVQTSDF